MKHKRGRRTKSAGNTSQTFVIPFVTGHIIVSGLLYGHIPGLIFRMVYENNLMIFLYN
jgi:hypothetical protein